MPQNDIACIKIEPIPFKVPFVIVIVFPKSIVVNYKWLIASIHIPQEDGNCLIRSSLF